MRSEFTESRLISFWWLFSILSRNICFASFLIFVSVAFISLNQPDYAVAPSKQYVSQEFLRGRGRGADFGGGTR